jgi:hypothetical protein
MNACGVATGSTVKEAYDKALSCDPISAFGGVLATNNTVDKAAAAALAQAAADAAAKVAATQAKAASDAQAAAAKAAADAAAALKNSTTTAAAKAAATKSANTAAAAAATAVKAAATAAQQAAQAGSNVGQLGLGGAKLSTALATSPAATTNPYSTALGGLTASPVFGQVVGGLFGSQPATSGFSYGQYGTGIDPSTGEYFGSLYF